MKRLVRFPGKSTLQPWLWLVLLAAVLPASSFPGPAEAGGFRAEPAVEASKPAVEPGAVEVRFTERSVLKLKLLDEKVAITTPYGNLLVPVADIQRIDFATRLYEADQKRIPVLIGNLASMDFATREAATKELSQLREKAYPALLQAAKSTDLEVAKRANDLIEKIRDAVSEEDLEVRPDDVILTANMKITGRITNPSLKATTSQFGELTLRLPDIRSLQSQAYSEADDSEALPSPGHLGQYHQQIGMTFRFRVTGAIGNRVWGTDLYTLDSMLESAAVHAGVLKPGQTGIVKVKIVPSPPMFQASTRHGVTSEGYAAYNAAYRFVK
jgi:hypothetical protein